ncbi:hypothetical protein [Arenimonas sp.]|jgi:hypothetical protein|uniref:hypothetical protein n=1 Tax=Arenimonas sp. TaxID=1872635 RepID=UPI0037C19798
MASSKLLKEAIADAKAVRETAIANAKIALEEAFTPRLQSILSKKLQAEMADDEEVEDKVEENNDVSSEIGGGDNKQPADKANNDDTDLSGIANQSAEVGGEVEDYDKVKDLNEVEDEASAEDKAEDAAEYQSEGEDAPEFGDDEESDDEDELDLESIIRELEAQIAGEEGDEYHEEEPAVEGEEAPVEEPVAAEPAVEAEEVPTEEPAHDEEEIDLDEILREMGYGDDEEKVEEAEEPKHDEEKEKLQAELAEAISTIKSLKGTINEVNLLNAKLLYANKLFRSYNLTNEQKVKVVENLDRTSSVREVKLVYATLAESMKFTGTERKVAAKKTMTEGFASKPQATTAPAKEIIAESSNELANRFKQLAGIVK